MVLVSIQEFADDEIFRLQHVLPPRISLGRKCALMSFLLLLVELIPPPNLVNKIRAVCIA